MVTTLVTDDLQAMLLQQARSNRRLVLVICGSRATELLPELQRRVVVRYVNREEVNDEIARLAVAN